MLASADRIKRTPTKSISFTPIAPTEVREMTLALEFKIIWTDLARDGKCDAPEGMEYQRVYREWMKDGFPLPIIPFIVQHANAPAPILAPSPNTTTTETAP
jgi:hypothetical protein